MEDIILLGMGGHAHSVVDSIEQAGKYRIIGFLDREEMRGDSYREYSVLGVDTDMTRLYKEGVRNAFVTVGFMGHGDIRERLYRQLKEVGYRLPNIIDDTAVISGNAELADGIFVGKNAVINANAKIGKMCIINTGAIIEHDCRVGDYSHVAVGSVLCGEVIVGKNTLIGANATVIQQKTVGDNCIIGAGTTIRKDVEDKHMIRDYEKVKIKRGGGNITHLTGCVA